MKHILPFIDDDDVDNACKLFSKYFIYYRGQVKNCKLPFFFNFQ